MKYQSKGILYIVAFLVLLLLVSISLLWGTIDVPFMGALKSVLQVLGLWSDPTNPLTKEQTAVFWYLRMPRVLVGLLVGAALALAGAVMQGLFSNPLADPGLLGVSSGAGLGAVLAIATGASLLSSWAVPAFATVGALLTVFITVGITLHKGRLHPPVLLLAGVAVSLLCGALTSGILTALDEFRMKEYLFWMIGGLDARHWSHVEMGLGPIVLGGALLLFLGRQLNVMSLGDLEAKALGLPVMTYRLVFLGLASVITAVAICMSGMIGFVGLIIPHIVRRLLGPDYRLVLPFSAIGGGIFLVACDTLGRLLPFPGEIRVGVMTALLGAPYFLYLLRVMRRGGSL